MNTKNVPLQITLIFKKKFGKKLYLLAVFSIVFAFISAVEKFSVEKLDSNNSKYELKENINNQDIEDIL